jgi:hypothetical protein
MVCQHVVTSMGPRNAYKDMLDKVVSPITCVNMNHQNQLEQMANEAMFATLGEKLPKLIFKKLWSVFECEKVCIPKPVLSRV